MELLHTKEEIKYFDGLEEQSKELFKLGKRYKNEELINLATKYHDTVVKELKKYDSYIGEQCITPPSIFSDNKVKKKGVIEGNFFFNDVVKSVVCNVRYTSSYGCGFDTYTITELE